MTTEKSSPTTGAVGPTECIFVFRKQNIKDETVSEVDLQVRHGRMWVANVWTLSDYRRCGFATELMQDVIKFADHFEHVLMLNVVSTGNHAPNDEELCAWYKTFGFVMIAGAPGMMRRQWKMKE